MTAHRDLPDFKQQVANHAWQWDSFAPVQAAERARLPESYKGLPNGHMASHQLLIDDFCTAVYFGRRPTVHAWLAARYTIPSSRTSRCSGTANRSPCPTAACRSEAGRRA